MKNINTTINGHLISLEYDHHYDNLYCVDVYINGSFKKTGDIDKVTAKLILEWISNQFNKAIKYGFNLCLAIYTSDGFGDHRKKMFERMGFVEKGPLFYKE